MTSLSRLGLLLSFSLVALAARADPVATLNVTAYLADGVTPVDASNVQTNTNLVLRVGYTINDLTVPAHLEVVACYPGASSISFLSGGDIAWGNPPGCVNVSGSGLRGTGPEISPAAGSSQAVTGVWSVGMIMFSQVVDDGTSWTIPFSLVLDKPSGPVTLTETDVTIIGHAHPQPIFDSQVTHLGLGLKPHGVEQGYEVTFQYAPNNYSWLAGGHFEPGSSVGTGTIPDGAEFVDSSMTVEDPANPYYAAIAALVDLNRSFTTGTDGKGRINSFTYSLDRMLSFGSNTLFSVTLWYPLSTVDAVAPVTMVFGDGTILHANPSAHFGLGGFYSFKQHFDWRDVWWTREAAHNPTYDDHLDAFTPVGAPLNWWVQITPFNAPMVRPVIIDQIPPHLEVFRIYALANTDGGNHDITAQTTVEYSTDAACSPDTSAWLPVGPSDTATLRTARCLRYTFDGIFNSEVDVQYESRLSPSASASLLSVNGSWEFEDGLAWLTIANQDPKLSASYSAVFPNQPLFMQIADRATIENQGRASLFTQPAAWAYPHTKVGSSFQVLGAVPYVLSSVGPPAGYDNLTFEGELPLELELDGQPFADPSVPLPVDAHGNAITPTCTWSAQDRSTTPVVPAHWRCTFSQNFPAYRQSPLTAPGCDTQLLHCLEDFRKKDQSGQLVANYYQFQVPEHVVTGYQGQAITQPMRVWSTLPPSTDGVALPSSSEASAFQNSSDEIDITGVQQLVMTKAAATSSVGVGGTLSYDVRFTNTGNVASHNLHIYDLFGRNSQTGALLGNGCQTPRFVEAHDASAGAGSLLEYTTASAPQPSDSSGWVGVIPSDRSTITGLRITPTSSINGQGGVFGPTDPSGHVVVTIADQAGVGSSLCNTVSISADQLDPSLASAAPASVTSSCSHLEFGPGEGSFGTLLFEDLWPANGDLDFNDLVVAYNFQFLSNDAGLVEQLKASFTVQAAGAKLHSGFFLHLPVPFDAASSIVLETESGAPMPLTAFAGSQEHELVLPLVADVETLFGVSGFVNTVSTEGGVAGRSFAVTVTFTQPVALDTGAAPFDSFIARSADITHQIHLVNFAGTDQMNRALFRTGDDRSGASRHFVNAHGLPFALAVAAEIPWPKERVSIENLFPHITTFAATGGGSETLWYEHDLNLANAYLHGSGTAAPPPALVGAALAAHCGP